MNVDSVPKSFQMFGGNVLDFVKLLYITAFRAHNLDQRLYPDWKQNNNVYLYIIVDLYQNIIPGSWK